MHLPIFKKALLTLAIAATPLSAQAWTVDLDNTPLEGGRPAPRDANGALTEDLIVVGTQDFGKDRPEHQLWGGTSGIIFGNDTLNHDLVLDASVQIRGNRNHNVVVDGATQALTVRGDFLNKGTIISTGDHANRALWIHGIALEGNLVNQGNLSARYEEFNQPGTDPAPSDALLLSKGRIKGNVINAQGSTILGEGTNSGAISLKGATIDGRIINQGLAQAKGTQAAAINLTEDPDGMDFDGNDAPFDQGSLGGIDNEGSVLAEGVGAMGLNIDSVNFTATAGQVSNSGKITADGTAIHIGAKATVQGPLEIHNSGSLSAGEHAVDATLATVDVNLTLDHGSQVSGNLTGLSALNVLGDVLFNGVGAGNHISMANGQSIQVGGATGAGHLQFGQDHTQIQGDLAVSAGSSLTVNPVQHNQQALTIIGTATFEQGAQIKVDALASKHEFTTQGSHFKLIQADQLVDHGLTVGLAGRSPLLAIHSNIDALNNNVTAQVALKSEAQIAAFAGKHGASGNSQSALVRLAHDGILSRLDDHDLILTTFAKADEQQLADLSSQLTPQIDGAATQAATTGQTLISNAASQRVGAVRGLSSGDAAHQTGLWMQSLNSDATQNNRAGVAGYNAKSNGLSFGADAKLNDQLTLGLAYSFLDSTINSQDGHKTTVDGHALTLYGGLEQGNYFADASLTYGLNDNKTERRIAGTKAKASYDSDLLGLNITAGYTYHLNPQWLIEPLLAARYSQVNLDGYRERGSSAALKVEDQRYKVLDLGVGVRLAAQYPLGRGTLVPQVKLMALQDVIADQVSSTSTFIQGSTPFVTSGAKPEKNSYEASIGTDYRLGAMTLGLNYEHVGKSGFKADTFAAKVRYDF